MAGSRSIILMIFKELEYTFLYHFHCCIYCVCQGVYIVGTKCFSYPSSVVNDESDNIYIYIIKLTSVVMC